ncbi:CHAT domain-containing protein [Streptomyces sp. FIT100]|uniref:CHAT domain-containing protein n=1 Tax=Streptomyces sp. FIT100 TaxID=2837956 RepID=UPI0021C9037F|nr:CHAT domain-containing protein [Streptomyces sp. FIT100]UUN30022.1 CHAT domain-containing protein [Streptomyces sp. FIT100]
MRLSRDVTGWAFLAEVGGVRHAGLAVGLAGVSPFTTGDGAGGSLFARARAWGMPVLRSLDELPFGAPADPRWCVVQDARGALCVRSPDGALFAHDLDLERPPGWAEAGEATGSVLLVVSHVFPATADPQEALAFETCQGMVCAGPVRFGTPSRAEDTTPTVTITFDPAGRLWDLANLVCERVLSPAEAARRARETERIRRGLAEGGYLAMSAEAMLDLLMREEFVDHRGLVELVHVYWRLVAELADACGVESAWGRAALRTAESAVPLVADRCEREVFEAADAVATRLIDRLSDPGDPGDPGGPGDPGVPADPGGPGGPGDTAAMHQAGAELEAALLAAARLRLATRGPEDFAADAYARGGRTTWAARMEAELYRTWYTDEEPLQKDSPRLATEAVHLLVRALQLDGGVQLPRVMASLAQSLGGEQGSGREAAGAALLLLLDAPVLSEPDLALFLIRVVDGAPPEAADAVLTAVFARPLADFVADHGRAVTSRVISQGINLARERAHRPLLETALDWAERLDMRPDPAHRRQLIEARLHALPGDPTDCSTLDEALSLAVPDHWTPAQRSAALLHMAAHARDRRQPALGLTLLRRVTGSASEELRLLAGDLHHQAAELDQPIPGPMPFPWGYYTYAALSYASLGFEDLARAALVPLAQYLGSLRGEDLKGALYALIVDLPNFDTSGAPELGEVLRDLMHTAVWQMAAEYETLPPVLMLGLHQAGKGAELGAWSRIDGPLELPVHIQHFVGMLRDLEGPAAVADAAPHLPDGLDSAPDVPDSASDVPNYAPNLLDVLDVDRRPPGGDDTQVARNLRRRISSFIDVELRRRSAPFVDEQRLWAHVHELLDDRTVLLTWFLPMHVRGAAVLLAVTRQGRALFVHLGGGDGESRGRHPLADRIEAIRTEIQHDPLFADVTPEGARLLEFNDTLLGVGDRWAEWRAQGKDRLLVWPHGALHYLPVPLCRAGGRTIADDWTVTTIAGLEALAPSAAPAPAPAAPAAPVRERRTAVLASAAGGVPYGLQAEPELESHARKVGEAVGVDAVTGPEATRAALLAELSTADVVHIAVHGTMDQDAPWMQCLYLSPDGDDDGRVFAHDFLGADLRGVRLVTLAACESALGRFDHGDNVRGIPSALVAAGAQAVVGCLWPVRPDPATYFYDDMHRRIAHGADAVQAFRDAQLATRVRYPAYRDWGAFTYLQGRSMGADT